MFSRLTTFIGRQSITNLLLFGALARLALLLYSAFHDATFRVKYTDIDYAVITDGAASMVKGGSPFERATFRYTPLLGLLMTPNVLVWHHTGKLLFCACDLFAAYFAYRVLLQSLAGSRSSGATGSQSSARADGATIAVETLDELSPSAQTAKVTIALCILLNPIIINISTRGNADMIITCLTLGVLYFFYRKQLTLASMFLGLAIHFKIYPIIYAAPLVFGLMPHTGKNHPKVSSASSSTLKQGRSSSGTRSEQTGKKQVSGAVPPSVETVEGQLCSSNWPEWLRQCVTCGVVTVVSFAIPTLICGHFYGQQYYYEAITYHFGRIDHRHNLSPYFYPAYLNMAPSQKTSTLAPGANSAYFSYTPDGAAVQETLHTFPGDMQGYGWLIKSAFIPQFLALLYVSWKLRGNVAHAFCVETLLFVAYNKVCTVQYFAWFIPFMPFILAEAIIVVTQSARSLVGAAPALRFPRTVTATIHLKRVRRLCSPLIISMTVGLWIISLIAWMLVAKSLEFDGEARRFFPLWWCSCFFFAAQVLLVLWLGRTASSLQILKSEALTAPISNKDKEEDEDLSPLAKKLQ